MVRVDLSDIILLIKVTWNLKLCSAENLPKLQTLASNSMSSTKLFHELLYIIYRTCSRT